MRHNASPYSGFVGTSCGTQKYLEYGPDGDSSKQHTQFACRHLDFEFNLRFYILLDAMPSVAGLLERHGATRHL